MADIQHEVSNAIYWDLAVPRHRVVARYNDGVVTLVGRVDLPYEKKCAEADVLRVPGVVGVKNEIIVQSLLTAASAQAAR